MIEITFTEVVLLAWAALATAAASKYRADARVGKRLLIMFIENKDAREQLVAAHAKFMEEQQ